MPSSDPLPTLFTCRILWAALLMGQIGYLIVVGGLLAGGAVQPVDAPLAHTLFLVSVVLLVLSVVTGYGVRGAVYKRNWQAGAVTPNGYLSGNLVLWAACEGPAMLAITVILLQGSFWPAVVPAAGAIGILAINFPNGAAMQSAHDPYPQSPPAPRP